MTAAMPMDIIVPFHGRLDLVRRCLCSLAANGPATARVMLVDDGSPPDKRARRGLDLSGLSVQWLGLECRRGFVDAVNLAWKRCRAPLTIVLNNDTIVPPDLLRRLGDCIARDDRIAAVSPASDNRVDLFQYRPSSVASGVTEVPYLTAACLAVRRATVGIGELFDPVYAPGYFEDLDLSCRLRGAGWRLGLLESCRVHHEGMATFGRDPMRAQVMRRNYVIFRNRWGHLDTQRDLERKLGLWGAASG